MLFTAMDATQREFFEKTQYNEKEAWATGGIYVKEALDAPLGIYAKETLAATCRICGGVGGLNLQDGTVAATCVYCYEASKSGTAARRIVNKSLNLQRQECSS